MKNIVKDLFKIASSLDKEGHPELADKLDKVALDFDTDILSKLTGKDKIRKLYYRAGDPGFGGKPMTEAEAFLASGPTIVGDSLPVAQRKAALKKAGKIGAALAAAYAAFKALSGSDDSEKLATEFEALAAMKDRAQAGDPQVATKIVNNALKYASSLRGKLGQPGYVATEEQQSVLLKLEKDLKEIAYDASNG